MRTNFEDATEKELQRLKKDLGNLFRTEESLQYLLYIIKARRKMLLNDLDNGSELKELFKAQGGRKEDKEIINFVNSCLNSKDESIKDD